jgi:hypothetical protein
LQLLFIKKMADPEGGKGSNENPLDRYIPDTFTELKDLGFGPVRIYRHEPTGCPVAIIVGGHQGTILGVIIYHREESDSMNMEIEVPMEAMEFIMEFLEKRLPSTKSRDNLEGLWSRFLDNLFQTLHRKRGFSKDGSPTPVIPPIERQAPQPQPVAPVPPVEDEAPTECMICLDRPPDTTVAPCLHSVVCADCSPQLEGTADAKICCQCRRPITGVYYPDNSFMTIKEVD